MSYAREQRYFDWCELQFDPSVYAGRRARILNALGKGEEVLIVPSRQGVAHVTFRQNDDFMYFTGLELPDSILVLDPVEGVVLYAPRRDPRFETVGRDNDFPGRPLADDPELSRRCGIDSIVPFEEFTGYLQRSIAAGRKFKINPSSAAPIEDLKTDFIFSWNTAQGLAHHLRQTYPDMQLSSAFADIARQRMVKGPEEIAALHAAWHVTRDAVIATAPHIRPGIDERTLIGILEAEFKIRGAQRPAFDPIIKSGRNSLWAWRILASHYDRRNLKLVDGELVVFDVGAELNHYICDIGRTFPVSGKFSDEQKQHLDMVTQVVDSIISAVTPGATFADLKRVALENLPADEHEYMQVGSYFGHHIGLNSGDPSLLDQPLEAGMVFTVEPWYYNHDRQLAVFTEENIVVTDTKATIISEGLPRDAAGLEALVKG